MSPALLNHEALVALSGLPKLETLHVLGSSNDYATRCGDLNIPANAFPSLKHLELEQLAWGTIANMCNSKALVSGLHSMTLSHPYNSDLYNSGDAADDRRMGLADIVSLLAANNSRISALTVRHSGDYHVLPETLESWARLPLISLELGWSRYNFCGFDALYSILLCLPLLEDFKLSMSQDTFELKELQMVVEILPRLRRIRLPVKWESITQLTRADFMPCRLKSKESLCITSDFYLQRPRQEGAELLARYLSLLRPTAPVICESFRPFFYRDYRSPDPYVDEQPKDMINLELSRLRLN